MVYRNANPERYWLIIRLFSEPSPPCPRLAWSLGHEVPRQAVAAVTAAKANHASSVTAHQCVMCLILLRGRRRLSGTTPRPPHVGHRCSSSVPWSTTPSPLQSGQVFISASIAHGGNAMGGRWRARDRLCLTVARPRDSEQRLHCAAVFSGGSWFERRSVDLNQII